jgi:hypothetical protein
MSVWKKSPKIYIIPAYIFCLTLCILFSVDFSRHCPKEQKCLIGWKSPNLECQKNWILAAKHFFPATDRSPDLVRGQVHPAQDQVRRPAELQTARPRPSGRSRVRSSGTAGTRTDSGHRRRLRRGRGVPAGAGAEANVDNRDFSIFSRFFEVLRDFWRFFEIFRDFSRLFEIFRDFSRLLKIFRDFSRFFEIFRDFLRFFEIFWDFSRFFEIFRDFSRFFEIFRDFSRFFEIFRDFSRFFEIFF